MTVQDVYDSALRFIGESTVDGDNDDYEERAPYIVAAFCAEVEATDRAIRKLQGKNEENSFSQVYLAFDNEFPLLEIFYTPAALYLAAMLVIDFDAELYDKLFERYCDSISSVVAGVSGVSEKIRNAYFND